MKAYRKEALATLRLYGEMHRYIPALLKNKGYKVTELKVRHHARKFGKTKYNMKRLLKGFLDLLFITFWFNYSTRPLHFFGSLGFLQYGLSFLIVVEQVVKAILIRQLTVGPLLLLAVLLIITGTLFIVFGFLGEILIRIYYEKTHDQSFLIEKVLE